MKHTIKRRILAFMLSLVLVLTSVNVPSLDIRAEEMTNEAVAVDSEAETSEAVTEAETEEEIPQEQEITTEEVVEETESTTEEIAPEEATEILEETTEEELIEEVAFEQSQTVDGVQVNVTADEGVFPADAVLSVSNVDAATENVVNDNVDEVRDENTNVAKSYTFDIKVLDTYGDEIQPDTTKGQVKVSFATEEVSNDNLDVDIYHVSDVTLEAEKLDSSVETVEGEQAVVAETDGFSYYTVEFTYNDLQYAMNGDSEIALADILTKVELTGTVTNAISSNPELFSVAEEGGEWTVSANQAFTSKEWLKVTIDGVEYEIVVTDSIGTATTLNTSYTSDYTLNSGEYKLKGNTEIKCRFDLAENAEVTIYLNGYTLKRTDNIDTATDQGGIFYLKTGAKLTIIGGNGKLIGGNNTTSGGTFVCPNGTTGQKVSISNLTIDGSKAPGGAVMYVISDRKLTVNNCTIQNCVASTNTGAFCLDSTSECTISNTKFINCKALGGGMGAIQIKSGTVKISNCSFEDCSASRHAGAIYSTGNTTLDHITIKNCKAGTSSGALYNGGTLTIKNSSITNCESGTLAGGIYNADNGTLNIENTSITGNHAGLKTGGGIFNEGSKVRFGKKVVITGNTSTKNNTTDNFSGCASYTTSKGKTYTADVRLANSLTTDSVIGVNIANSKAEANSYQAGIVTHGGYKTYHGSTAPTKYFTSDSKAYAVTLTSAGEVQLVTHSHQWAYATDANKLYAYCANSTLKCGYYGTSKTANSPVLTLDVADMDYTGKPYDKAKVTPSANWSETGQKAPGASDVSYEGIDGTTYTKTTPPTDVGTYQASITVGGKKATATFKITKKEAAVTAPTAKALTYNGSAQALVGGGSTSAGTIYYRVDNGTWSTTVPTATDVKYNGKSVVGYKVDYYVKGDANYDGKGSEKEPAGSFDVSISPKKIEEKMIHLGFESQAYAEKEITQTVTVKDGERELVIGKDITLAGDALTQEEANTYTVKVIGQGNYIDEKEKSWRITAEKFGDKVSINGYDGTYDAEAHGITVAIDDSLKNVKVEYKTTKDGAYSTTAPAFTDAGEYTVYYQITKKGYEAATGSKTVKIAKATATANWEGETFTYNGKEVAPTVTWSGIVASDQDKVDTSVTSAKKVGTHKATAALSDKEGYDVVKNYTLANTTKAFTIEKAKVVVTPKENQSKTYGEKDPTFAYEASGLIGEDTLDGALGRKAEENKGAYEFTLGTLSNDNYDISLAKDAPRFTINPKPAAITWTKADLTFKGTEQEVRATVSNAVGSDTFNITYQKDATAVHKASEVGTYQAVVTGLGNDNYTLEGATGISTEWSISYLEAKDAVVTGTKTAEDNAWYISTVTLTPDADTAEISADGKTWKSALTFSEDGAHRVDYYLRAADGTITDKKSVEFQIDTKVPTGEINIRENAFKAWIQNITKGYFFEKSIDVKVSAEDLQADGTGSGMDKIEYQKVAKGEAFDRDGEWTEYKAFSVAANDKFALYVKLTDKAGNVSIINSENIVVYTNATDISDRVYEKKSADLKTGVMVHGNTVKAVTMILADNETKDQVLSADDYRVEEDELVIGQDFLDALEGREYTFDIAYNPYGEEYTEASVGTPAENSTLNVTLEKAEGHVVISDDLSKVYDGRVVSNPACQADSTGKVTYAYKLADAPDSAYQAVRPKDAGEYVVKVSVEADTYYSAASATKKFEIAKKEATIEVKTVGEKEVGDEFTLDFTVNHSTKTTVTSSDESIATVDENGKVKIVGIGTVKLIISVEEGKNFAATSKEVVIKTKRGELKNPVVTADDVVYNGEAQTPAVRLTDGGVLIPEEDYKVSYADNKNAGQATITVMIDGREYTGHFTIEPKQVKATVELAKEDSFVYDGTKKTPAVVVKDGEDVIPAEEYTVSYTGNTDAGTATITVNDKAGNYVVSGEASFTIEKAEAELSVSPKVEKTYKDADFTLDVKQKGTEAPAFESSDEKVAKVDATTGQVTLIGAGEAVITVSVAEGKNYKADSKEVALTVNKKAGELSMSKIAYEVTYGDADFTIREITSEGESEVTFTSSDDKVAKVDSTGKVQVGNVGEATITLEMKESANYTGITDKVTVKVLPKEVKAPSVTLVDRKAIVYDGSAKKPAVIVKDGEDVIPAEEYTVSYKDNENAGTATVIITDNKGGNYTVSGETTFVIEKAETELSVKEVEPKTYKDAAFALDVTTREGAKVTYTSTDEKVATVDKDGKVTVVGAGKAEIKVSVAEEANYKPAEKSVEISVLPKEVKAPSITLVDNTAIVYDGSAKKPAVIVKDGEDVIPAEEYTVSYKDNKNAGTATVIITDNKGGNYTVSGESTFVIEKAETELSVGKVEPKTYKDKAFDLEVTTREGAKVSYESYDKKVVTVDKDGKVTVVGAGKAEIKVSVAEEANYKPAEKSVEISVLPKEVKAPSITLVDNTAIVYDGSAKKPAVIVKDGEDVIPAEEYTVSYKDNENAGTATIIITDNKGGNYTVSGETTFVIEKAETELSVKEVEPKTYKDAAFALDVTTREGAKVTYTSTDEKVATVDKDGKVTVVGAGKAEIKVSVAEEANYKPAETKVEISVLPKEVKAEVVLKNDSFVYDGTEKTPAVTVKDGEDVIPESEYTVSYKDNENAGTATVIIADKDGGNYVVSGEASFTIEKAEAELSVSPKVEKTYKDADFTLAVTQKGTEAPAFESSDDKVAKVDKSGKVTLIGAGEAVITVSVAEGKNYKADSKEVALTVNKKAGELSVSKIAYEVTYGDADFTIGKITSEGESEVTFASSDDKVAKVDGTGKVQVGNVGEATITLEMKESANYTGITDKVTVKVLPKEVKAPSITLADDKALVYDGSAKTPAVIVKDGENVIPAEEYTVSYKDNENAGTATIIITDKDGGNYIVSGESIFVIEKAEPELSVKEVEPKTYEDAAFALDVTAREGAKVTYTSSDEKVATVDENGKVTIIGAGKAEITVSVAEEENYKSNSKEVAITVNPKPVKADITIKGIGKNGVPFDGKPKKPAVVVKDGDQVIPADEYTVVYKNNVKPGKVIITLKDKTGGNYVVTGETTFKITNPDVKAEYGRLKARATKATKDTLLLQWTKVPQATSYKIYGNFCNHDGQEFKLEYMTTVDASKASLKLTKLQKGTYYKMYVAAYQNIGGVDKQIAKSVVVHATTTGGNRGHAKAVKITKLGTKKYNTTKAVKYTLTAGNTVKISAVEVKQSKKIAFHRELNYESSNTKVATVGKDGTIKAVGKGSCQIWVYAQNGVYNTINITVK